MALHGGIAIWFSLPAHAPLQEPPAQPLRVSLLATVEETTVNAPIPIPEPSPEPISEPVLDSTPVPPPEPQSLPDPRPVLDPVIQEAPPEPQPPVRPTPEAEPEPVIKSAPEHVRKPDHIQEIALPSPIESVSAPLDEVASAQYGQLFRAWLEKHKIYPRRAQRLRIEGEGMLRIRIDRTGRIQQVTLEKRTGNRLLDRAALDMARRADPFPPIPENDSRRELEFIVPVVFTFR